VTRKIWTIIAILAWGLFGAAAWADTFKLLNGETVTGEVLAAAANDAGLQIRVGEGDYRRIPWANFTQDDLRQFAQNKKLEPFVEPFIEVSEEEKIKKTEVNLKEPPRLALPPPRSVLGALCSSGLGLLILLLLYAANLYAAYEVSIFRAQPVGLVCGVSAVVPFAGPIIFLCMPTKRQVVEASWDAVPQPAANAPAVVNPMLDASVAHPSGLHLAPSDTQHGAAPALPPTTVFKRGQFTFNRRFFETRFAGFFGVVRRDADRDMMLLVKTMRGQFVVERISRITGNEVHFVVQKGAATEEVMAAFTEIQEIQLKHKDAP
jgi:hypothetical protein